jgi:hypothetical protein
MKEFEDWEATTNKTWTSLKEFIHGAFQRRLVVVDICSISAQYGYAPVNKYYTMLANKFVDSDDDTIIKHTAAGVTAGSSLGNMYATPALTMTMNNNLTPAINLLVANQQALYQHIAPLLQHMAAMSFHAQPLLQARMFPAPNTTHIISLPSRAHPRDVSTLVHPCLLLVASTQDKVDVVMGAVAVDMVIVAAATPHLQLTWLPKEVVFRVQAGHLSRMLVVRSTPHNK